MFLNCKIDAGVWVDHTTYTKKIFISELRAFQDKYKSIDISIKRLADGHFDPESLSVYTERVNEINQDFIRSALWQSLVSARQSHLPFDRLVDEIVLLYAVEKINPAPLTNVYLFALEALTVDFNGVELHPTIDLATNRNRLPALQSNNCFNYPVADIDVAADTINRKTLSLDEAIDLYGAIPLHAMCEVILAGGDATRFLLIFDALQDAIKNDIHQSSGSTDYFTQEDLNSLFVSKHLAEKYKDIKGLLTVETVRKLFDLPIFEFSSSQAGLILPVRAEKYSNLAGQEEYRFNRKDLSEAIALLSEENMILPKGMVYPMKLEHKSQYFYINYFIAKAVCAYVTALDSKQLKNSLFYMVKDDAMIRALRVCIAQLYEYGIFRKEVLDIQFIDRPAEGVVSTPNGHLEVSAGIISTARVFPEFEMYHDYLKPLFAKMESTNLLFKSSTAVADIDRVMEVIAKEMDAALKKLKDADADEAVINAVAVNNAETRSTLRAILVDGLCVSSLTQKSTGHGLALVKAAQFVLDYTGASQKSMSIQTIDNSGSAIFKYNIIAENGTYVENQLRRELCELVDEYINDDGENISQSEFRDRLYEMLEKYKCAHKEIVHTDLPLEVIVARIIEEHWDYQFDPTGERNAMKFVIEELPSLYDLVDHIRDLPITVAFGVVPKAGQVGGGFMVHAKTNHIASVDKNGMTAEQKEEAKQSKLLYYLFNPMLYATLFSKAPTNEMENGLLFVADKKGYKQAESASTHLATASDRVLKRIIRVPEELLSEIFQQNKTINETDIDTMRPLMNQLLENIEHISQKLNLAATSDAMGDPIKYVLSLLYASAERARREYHRITATQRKGRDNLNPPLAASAGSSGGGNKDQRK